MQCWSKTRINPPFHCYKKYRVIFSKIKLSVLFKQARSNIALSKECVVNAHCKIQKLYNSSLAGANDGQKETVHRCLSWHRGALYEAHHVTESVVHLVVFYWF